MPERRKDSDAHRRDRRLFDERAKVALDELYFVRGLNNDENSGGCGLEGGWGGLRLGHCFRSEEDGASTEKVGQALHKHCN